MARKEPDPVDKLVGRNIRIHRLAKGLSQTGLGDQLGVTFQQVQKYEKGHNRVGSGRLFRIASILGVHVTVFYEGSDRLDSPPQSPLDFVDDPQSFRLVRAFSEIQDVHLRRSLVELIESIAQAAPAAPGT
jgi:transcriptional regulator with XRE-family HTH domain